MLTQQELAYYGNPSLWGDEPDLGERAVIQTVRNLIPTDCQCLLDVGAGDGKILDRLPASLAVEGIEPVDEARQHCKRTCRAGRLPSLPYQDRAWDMVLACDVLEHIQEADYTASLAEIARVAARWILVVSPLDEAFTTGVTTCGACECDYHVNFHQRVFPRAAFDTLFDGFTVEAVEKTGYRRDREEEALIRAREVLGYRTTTRVAPCPVCGALASRGRDPDRAELERTRRRILEAGQEDVYTEVAVRYRRQT